MREIVTERLVLRLLRSEHVPAFADDRNVAVQRLLERLGFRCEARLVEADWFKGEWTTLRTYAVLRREWPTRSATYLDFVGGTGEDRIESTVVPPPRDLPTAPETPAPSARSAS